MEVVLDVLGSMFRASFSFLKSQQLLRCILLICHRCARNKVDFLLICVTDLRLDPWGQLCLEHPRQAFRAQGSSRQNIPGALSIITMLEVESQCSGM